MRIHEPMMFAVRGSIKKHSYFFGETFSTAVYWSRYRRLENAAFMFQSCPRWVGMGQYWGGAYQEHCLATRWRPSPPRHTTAASKPRPRGPPRGSPCALCLPSILAEDENENEEKMNAPTNKQQTTIQAKTQQRQNRKRRGRGRTG